LTFERAFEYLQATEISFQFHSKSLNSGVKRAVQSGNNATAEVLQRGETEARIEVAIEKHGESERVVLRHLTWTDGLGWCAQKTICLEADQIDDVHRALLIARHRFSRKRAELGESGNAAQVIQLPTFA
jgi:hypothetical protein